MKKIFLVLGLFLFCPQLAEAQTSRNPCYTTDGSNCIGVGSSTPLPVTGNSGGFDVSVTFTPTVDNAAYASGDALFDLQTITFFRSTAQPSGILNNIFVASKGGSTVAMTLYIFTSNPSASTCTKNAPIVLNAADISKLIATIPIVLTPAVVGTGTTVTTASLQTPISIKSGEAGLSLYVCASTAVVTPASTTDLVFKFAGIQD